MKHKIIEKLVPSVSPLLKKKKHMRLGHAGIVDHSVDRSILDLKSILKKGIDRSNKKYIYKCITANTSIIWQHAAHTTDQLTILNC